MTILYRLVLLLFLLIALLQLLANITSLSEQMRDKQVMVDGKPRRVEEELLSLNKVRRSQTNSSTYLIFLFHENDAWESRVYRLTRHLPMSICMYRKSWQ